MSLKGKATFSQRFALCCTLHSTVKMSVRCETYSANQSEADAIQMVMLWLWTLTIAHSGGVVLARICAFASAQSFCWQGLPIGLERNTGTSMNLL